MDERIVKFRVGVVVVATFLVAGTLMLLIGRVPFLVSHYPIFVWLPKAPGVGEDTAVRKDGILIGRVKEVKLLDQGGVVLTLRLDDKYKLRRSEVCELHTSVLGDAVLEFVPGPNASNEFIHSGDYLEGIVGGNPLDVFGGMQGELSQAVGSVSTAGREIGRLAVYINEFMISNDEQLNRIVDKTELALDSFQKMSTDLDSLVGDEQLKANLKQSLADLPTLLKDMHNAVEGIRTTVALADSNLRNLEGLTKPLGEHGEEMISNIDASMARLNDVLSQFVDFGKALNNREGTLGRILYDPQLYNRIDSVACNIEQLTKDLKPIVRNVNIFTDKLARHPGTLVREALKPNSGIK